MVINYHMYTEISQTKNCLKNQSLTPSTHSRRIQTHAPVWVSRVRPLRAAEPDVRRHGDSGPSGPGRGGRRSLQAGPNIHQLPPLLRIPLHPIRVGHRVRDIELGDRHLQLADLRDRGRGRAIRQCLCECDRDRVESRLVCVWRTRQCGRFESDVGRVFATIVGEVAVGSRDGRECRFGLGSVHGQLVRCTGERRTTIDQQ